MNQNSYFYLHEIIIMLLLHAGRLNQRTERENHNQKVIVWFMWWLWWWSCDLWWSCCSCEVAEWFELDDSKNTNVYVSGLPTDITLDEFKELMQQKGGIVAADDEGITVLWWILCGCLIWTFVCVYNYLNVYMYSWLSVSYFLCVFILLGTSRWSKA